MSSEEVQDAIGAAATDEERAARLRKILTEPSEKERAAAELAAVEQRIAAKREATGNTAAVDRMKGIRRAFGSHAAELRDLETSIQQKRDELTAEIVKWNHFHGLQDTLAVEATCLSDRFGVPARDLKFVYPNVDLTLPSFRERTYAPPVTEKCEHQLRQRRTYTECTGTDAYDIIMAAGLKPFPPLTERQCDFIEHQKEVTKQNQRFVEQVIQPEAEALALLPQRGRFGLPPSVSVPLRSK